ncbi:MAG: hypothetical protein COV52_03470 [Gammaproteobacteria bacterium CG11_big_fil_rev_8_21_14_0_20_46_22]|nr:MAG: hypothetical protein COW05_09735 [Gammaproteobacteria bacterium CG12_big_fil_rev_8_21_14_0_65_46_12]PIR11533.1 MAG: hypothetical protein COV52_03470 [Gammaproteobacteria bacterium CG11_big_fil_rev_8_21_14_0_20_46_22]
MRKFSLCLLVTLCCSLSGCFIIAGGAVIGGMAYVIHDHRSIAQAHEDQNLQYAIAAKLNQNASINQPNTYIYVTVFYGQVLLSGQVPNADIKSLAGSITKGVSGINTLYNELQIRGRASDMTRLSDSWINTKVKMHMLTIKDLKSSQVSINVNNGIVYVLGHNLTPLQARWMADNFDQIDGVQKVVICGTQPASINTQSDNTPIGANSQEPKTNEAKTSEAASPASAEAQTAKQKPDSQDLEYVND